MRGSRATRLGLLTLGVVATLARGARAQDSTTAPLPAPPTANVTPFTLQDAIRVALTVDINVLFARNTTRLDSLEVRELANQFLPNLSGSAQSGQGFGSLGQNALSLSAGISSGLTLYNGRQNINSLHEAQITAQAGVRDLARARQTVVFMVASQYLALMTAQEQLRVEQENLTAQQQELVQLQAFTNAGTHPIGDLYEQQAAVASTQLAVANASHSIELAKVDLIQELRLDPRLTYVFDTPNARGDLGAPVKFNLDSLITVALANRTDVQAQTLRVEAARRAIEVADGGRFPVVSASGGFSSGYNSGTDGSFASQLNQRRGGSIGVSASIPIFDRGAVSIARERAQIQLENEQLTLRDETETAALDVRRAYLDYEAAEEQLTASTAQRTAAALALQAAKARYELGVSTLVEVTLARATLVEAQSGVVNARSSLVFQRALMSYYTGVLDPTTLRLDR